MQHIGFNGLFVLSSVGDILCSSLNEENKTGKSVIVSSMK